MLDQYFGIKELYEVVLRAKVPMTFGKRQLEADEPVLYFTNISMAVLNEKNAPIMARGGWSNMPRVIWEDRSEVQFTLSEGVLSSISMGMLLSANVTSNKQEKPLLISKREGPFDIGNDRLIFLQHWPVENDVKKTFIFEYDRDVIQKKIYGKRNYDHLNPFDPTKKRPCIELFKDKECHIPADINRKYLVDYYYEYDDGDALIYAVQKERFNGLFTLEGKFYSKDENEGIDYTNLIYMPKVRIVSDINMRLGERADPTVGTFHIIGLPETTASSRTGLILEITRLSSDVD